MLALRCRPALVPEVDERPREQFVTVSVHRADLQISEVLFDRRVVGSQHR